MTDETKLREQQLRGDEAARLKDNPLLKDFFAGLKKEAIDRWVNTPIDAAATREDAWRMYKAVELLEGKLVVAVKNGEHALKQITQQQKEKDT